MRTNKKPVSSLQDKRTNEQSSIKIFVLIHSIILGGMKLWKMMLIKN